MDTNACKRLPFDVNDPEVQRACRAVARLLMDDAGEKEAHRTVLAMMVAATGGPQRGFARRPVRRGTRAADGWFTPALARVIRLAQP